MRRHAQTCGDMQGHAETCADIRRHAQTCGDMRRHAEMCGDMRGHHVYKSLVEGSGPNISQLMLQQSCCRRRCCCCHRRRRCCCCAAVAADAAVFFQSGAMHGSLACCEPLQHEGTRSTPSLVANPCTRARAAPVTTTWIPLFSWPSSSSCRLHQCRPHCSSSRT